MAVLVVGAGPAGLATAASLELVGIPFRLVDRDGRTGGAYEEVVPDLVLASPRRYTVLPGLVADPGGEYVTTGEYRDYLRRYARHFGLVAEKREVVRISREGDGFLVRFADGEERFPFVVVATGMFDSPVFPEIDGLPRDERCVHSAAYRRPPAGTRVLVIGAATSGVEIAEDCARAGAPVTVSTRSGIKILPQRFLGRDLHDWARLFEPLPRWTSRFLGVSCEDRPTLPGTDLGFKEFVKAGKIRERGPVRRFEGMRAFFADGSAEDFDRIFCATGYAFAMPFLDESVARARAGHPRTRRNESTTWRNLFFVGTPCAGSMASEFLRGMVKDAPAVAEEIRRRTRGPTRLLGASAIAGTFLLVHMAAIGFRATDLLWACNAATLVVAVGLALGSARVSAIGFLWLLVGLFCWLLDLAIGTTEYHWTTALTHLGGFAVGAHGAWRLGIPRGSWWRSMLGLVAIQQLARLTTDAAENVNLAFSVHGTAQGLHLPYPVYYALVTVAFTTTFVVAEGVAGRLGLGRAVE